MLCDTCRYSERPGFVRGDSAPRAARAAPVVRTADLVPCPDCGGAAIAHCCEGLCEQPDPGATGER